MTTQDRTSPPAGAPSSERREARQLIICCDGTSNSLTGGTRDTNVLRLFAALDPHANHQRAYYDPGVGAPDELPATGPFNWLRRRAARLFGLAMGNGIYENIAQAYEFLMREYRAGDQIFIFGFSRGAFTARCVAGMVNLFGIVRAEHASLMPTLLSVYFSDPEFRKEDTDPWRHPVKAVKRVVRRGKQARERVADQVRANFCAPHGQSAPVFFVGVWDTVASVGFPILFSRQISSEPTTLPKKHFRHIRHALALDEHRSTFKPRLYAEADYNRLPAEDRSLKQQWFCGAHSDVGGGYAQGQAGLSIDAYRWMLAEAVALGLRVRDGAVAVDKARVHDEAFDRPWWALAGLTARHSPRGTAAPLPTNPDWVWRGGIGKARLGVALLAAIATWYATAYCSARAVGAATTSLGALFDGAKQFNSALLFAAASSSGLPTLAATELHWAALALWADFGFIASYGWLLGFAAAGAFARWTGLRTFQQPVPRLNLLGWAPCVLVAADVAESAFGLLWFSSLAAGSGWNALWAPLLSIAAAFKWVGLGASVLLLLAPVASRIGQQLSAHHRQ